MLHQQDSCRTARANVECCSSSPMGRSFCSSFLSNLLSCRALLKEAQDDYRYLTGSSKGAKTDAEGKNAEGDLNGGVGVHSSCSADFSSSELEWGVG